MKLHPSWRVMALVALVALIILFCALSFQNSLVVSAVAIKLREGVKETLDPAVFNLAREHQLPDYRVKLHVQRKLLNVDLGTRLDTSATN
jgi:hypothetical protein